MEQTIKQIQKTIIELSNLLWIKIKKEKKWPQKNLEKMAEIIKGKTKVENSSQEGNYRFFACSDKISYVDEASLCGKYTVLRGSFNIQCEPFNGKFDISSHVWALKTKNNQYNSSLFFSIRKNCQLLQNSLHGTVIKEIRLISIKKLKVTVITQKLDIKLENLLYSNNNLELIKKNIRIFKELLIKKLIC